MKTYTTLLLLILVLCSLLSCQTIEGRGLGVGPNYIQYESALRNSTYQTSVFIYNQNPYDTNIDLNTTGEIEDWINFYELGNTSVPINSTFIEQMTDKAILLKITIPSDAANREYSGSAVVSSQPIDVENASGNFSVVDLTLPISIVLNITGDQIVNISVERMEIDDAEINYPARIRVQYKNNGNVKIAPTTKITFTKDGNYIDQLISTDDPIQPSEISTHTLQWNTTGKISGNYVARVEHLIDDTPFSTNNISFSLLPPGTFTRDGKLEDITYEGTLEKGSLVKIIATFRNTGEIETNAKFIGEVYHDDKLITTIESQESIVPRFQQQRFVSYLQIEEEGTYRVQGFVLFGGRSTNTGKTTFTVGLISSLLVEPVYLLAIALVIALSVAFILLKKYNKLRLPKKSMRNIIPQLKKPRLKKPKISIKIPKIKLRMPSKPKPLSSPAHKNKSFSKPIQKKQPKPPRMKKPKKLKIKKKEPTPKKEKTVSEKEDFDSMSAKELEEYVNRL